MLHWSDTWTCTFSGGLVAAYADPFVRRGGTLRRGDATTLADGAGWRVEAADGASPPRRRLRPRRRSFAISPPEKAAPWIGERLSMPDMLPVVGDTPRHRGFWCRFGHGHRGFTLGPATGALLAAWMEGERDPITCALSPTRANLG